MEYTIDQMAETAVRAYKLSPATAMHYVKLAVVAIENDPKLWNAENNTATADGCGIVVGQQIEAEMSADPGGYDAKLRRAVEKVKEAQKQVDAATLCRDEMIRFLTLKKRNIGRVAAITEMSRSRIYQIRSGHSGH